MTHPRWRAIARCLGAWPSSIRFAALFRPSSCDRVRLACEWADVTQTERGGLRRWVAYHQPSNRRAPPPACRNRGCR